MTDPSVREDLAFAVLPRLSGLGLVDDRQIDAEAPDSRATIAAGDRRAPPHGYSGAFESGDLRAKQSIIY